MSVSTSSNARMHLRGWQRAVEYLQLTKPKIVLMELVTEAVAAVVADSGAPDLWLLSQALVGALLVAAGACAWNQWLERHTDGLMDRTARRPLPAGRLSAREAALSGAAVALVGVVYLGAMVNLLTAALGALTWLTYVGVYTPLKARSPASIPVGAVAGALPILMGWTAVTGGLNLSAAALFLIVFLWQFPHVMAIAWIYRQQYAAAGLKLLPVADPTGYRAGVLAVAGAAAVVPVSVMPATIGFAGPTYFVWALALGAGQLFCAAAFLFRRDNQTARVLLRATLIYLPALLLWLAGGSICHH